MSAVRVGQVYESTDPRDIPPRRLQVMAGSLTANGFRPASQAWVLKNLRTNIRTKISERQLLTKGSRGYKLVEEAPDAGQARE